jgi:NADPH-dependent 2,4-dienoyl-CoA reductase/sulfur reductase-like enzyme
VDTIINQARILVQMLRSEWGDEEVSEALMDMVQDEDVRVLLLYAAQRVDAADQKADAADQKADAAEAVSSPLTT